MDNVAVCATARRWRENRPEQSLPRAVRIRSAGRKKKAAAVRRGRCAGRPASCAARTPSARSVLVACMAHGLMAGALALQSVAAVARAHGRREP
jgi:hypothetical protein